MCADDHQMYTNDNDVQMASQTLRPDKQGSVTIVQRRITASQSLKIPDPNLDPRKLLSMRDEEIRWT